MVHISGFVFKDVDNVVKVLLNSLSVSIWIKFGTKRKQWPYQILMEWYGVYSCLIRCPGCNIIACTFTHVHKFLYSLYMLDVSFVFFMILVRFSSSRRNAITNVYVNIANRYYLASILSYLCFLTKGILLQKFGINDVHLPIPTFWSMRN